jgi:P27 family predicted phage terminase small subunit
MNTKTPKKNIETPLAPRGLSDRSGAFWRQTVTAFELENHHLRILEEACRSLDRATEAREILARDGLTTTDNRGNLKAHPAVAVEASSVRLFRTMLRELGLDVASVDEGYTRPPTSTTGRRTK